MIVAALKNKLRLRYKLSLKLDRTSLYSSLFAAYSFFFSLIFLGLYFGGDQRHYTEFYENVSNYNFIEGYLYYNARLGAREPVYYILVYVLSPLFSKNLLFSVINGLLGYFLAKGLMRLKMHPLLLIPVGVNFYLLVLFLSAERLKVSLTFLLLALIFNGNKKKLLFYGLALLSHFQTMVLFVTRYAGVLSEFVRSLLHIKLYSKAFRVFYFLVVGLGIFFVFRDAFLGKISFYVANFGGIGNVIKPCFFLLLTLRFRPKKILETVLLHLPIIIAAYFLGDLRMTIFSFFIFMFYGVQYKRGVSIVVLIILLYFMIQSFGFLKNVILYGNGF